MRGYPCAAHVPVGPHDASIVLAHGVGHGPDVGVVTQAPTSLHTVVGFCRLLSRQAQRRDEVHQRHVHLAEVGHLCQPVVFFEVDVARIVAAPGWQLPFVPQPLQVGRYGLRPRTGDEQIACILEVEFFQVGVRLAKLCIAQQLSVGRQCSYLGRCRSQVEIYAAEVGLIVGDVPYQQFVVGHSHGTFHTLCGKQLVVASFCYRIFVETIETGDVDNQEQCFGAIFEHQPTVGLAADRSVGRHNVHQRAEVDAPLRIVEVFLRQFVQIVGVRMVGSIAVDRHHPVGSRCRDGQGRVEAETAGQRRFRL